MPLYFFHVHDGKAYPDNDGVELRDADDARTQAVVASGEALKDAGRSFWNSGKWSMHVVDEDGKSVCRLSFVGEELEADVRRGR